MGLFDKIAKVGTKVVKDATSEESKAKAKELFGTVSDKITETAVKVTSEESKEKAAAFLGSVGNKLGAAAKSTKNYIDDALKEEPEESTKKAAFENDGVPCRMKLLKVLVNVFPQYQVRENVSATEFGGTGKFMKYSIAVMDGEQPKLYIMIIGKTTCSHREYRFAKEFAQCTGVPMINFIEHYPNEVDYIADRLHKYL